MPTTAMNADDSNFLSLSFTASLSSFKKARYELLIVCLLLSIFTCIQLKDTEEAHLKSARVYSFSLK